MFRFMTMLVSGFLFFAVPAFAAESDAPEQLRPGAQAVQSKPALQIDQTGEQPAAQPAQAEPLGLGLRSASYMQLDWEEKLDIMREVVATFHVNKCAVALVPEDLMRIVDADLKSNWKEDSADITVGAWVCNLVQLDEAKCIRGE